MAPLSLLALPLYAVTALASHPHGTRGNKPTATLDAGVVVGTTTSVPGVAAPVNHFLGIPYAEFPERFTVAEPVKSWKGQLQVGEWKPSCIQQFSYPLETRNYTIELYNSPPPPAGEAEDCMHINVITPAKAAKKPRAVLFWIFGGGLQFGTGTHPWYEGSSFAGNQDVVVVTFNYRTNIFGFPNSPDIDAAEKNLGLLDQRLALDWVQRNIAKFGGDPKKVTIFGQSSGAFSVDALINAPPDPLPFRAAILQSGQGSIATATDTSGSWPSVAERTNCTDAEDVVDCIRKVPATELKSILEVNSIKFGHTKDGGVTVANTPRKNRAESTKESSIPARIPVMIGNNADEGSTVSMPFGFAVAAAFLSQGKDTANYTQKLNESYAIGSPGIPNETQQVKRIVADLIAHCPSRLYTDEANAVGINTWRYFYNASFPNTDPYPDLGAWHAAEIPVVFETYDHSKGTEFEAKLSKTMQKAWADFAKDPTKGPGWGKSNKVGVFAYGNEGSKVPLKVVDAKEIDARCAFYSEFYTALGDNGISGLT